MPGGAPFDSSTPPTLNALVNRWNAVAVQLSNRPTFWARAPKWKNVPRTHVKLPDETGRLIEASASASTGSQPRDRQVPPAEWTRAEPTSGWCLSLTPSCARTTAGGTGPSLQALHPPPPAQAATATPEPPRWAPANMFVRHVWLGGPDGVSFVSPLDVKLYGDGRATDTFSETIGHPGVWCAMT